MRDLRLNPGSLGYSGDMALHNAVWAVTKAEWRASQTAKAMNENPTFTPTPPRVGAVGSPAGDYVYRVLITVRDAAGRPVSTSVEYRSQTPVSAARIESSVATRIDILSGGLAGSDKAKRVSEIAQHQEPVMQIISSYRE